MVSGPQKARRAILLVSLARGHVRAAEGRAGVRGGA